MTRRRPIARTCPGTACCPADQGSGLIAWAEAERRLTVSHDYWCATVRPDGAPHVMPVWGVWLDGRLWFSSSLRSRKARNLAVEPRCTLTTDDAADPVVLEGVAERITDRAAIGTFLDAVNAKYDAGLSPDFLDPGGQRQLRRPPGAGLRAEPRRLHRQPHPLDLSRNREPDHIGDCGRRPSALTLLCRTCGASRVGVPSTSDALTTAGC